MDYLDRTWPTPEANLACDEALLDLCEASESLEVLRFWEPTSHFVVLGYGNKVDTETNLAACEAAKIPLLRRTTGGGTVLQGPGCLNYSVILQIHASGALQSVAGTNEYVMARQARALSGLLGRPVEQCGSTDLALGGGKFSGNAQRRKRRCLLFHGSILLNFDLALLDVCLAHPSREPEYRRGRAHRDFVINLALAAGAVKAALGKVWGAERQFDEVPEGEIARLVQEKYGRAEWNLKF